VQQVEAVIDDERLLRHPLSIRNMVAALAPPDADLSEQMSLLNVVPPPLRDVVLNESERRTIVTARMQDVGLAKYSPVFKRVGKRLEDLENKYPGFECEITGDPIVRNSQLYRIVTDLATSLGTACVLIFVVMAFAFRSLRLGLISIVPNLLPLLTTAAFLIVTGQMLTFTSVCAFTVCIGIAVDDTIHFLTRYHFFRGQGQTVDEALRETFVNVGTALITTTLVLVTGFGTVLMSALPSHRMFASMAVCTIGTALFADLIFLPAMLAHFRGKTKTEKGERAARLDSISAAR
jgi:predicted RND superfamily exporter protein